MFLPFRHVNHLWHLLTAGFLLLFGVGQAAVGLAFAASILGGDEWFMAGPAAFFVLLGAGFGTAR